MRICIIYDCLFPWTIGGAENWYRNLAERLAANGHEIIYLTLQQWDDGEAPNIPGVRVIPVGPRMPLYKAGKRRIIPPVRFGLGVLWHLLRNRHRYDHLHMASFPYFSLLAAAVVRPIARYRMSVDWFEVWSRSYWDEYLGRAGAIGWWVQKLCARVPQQAYCFSRLHGERLAQLGLTRPPTHLTGLYLEDDASPPTEAEQPPTILFAGRMIAEKRVDLLVEALPMVFAAIPEARALLFGQGPELEKVRARIAELRLEGMVATPGFVERERLDDAMGKAAVVVQPSAREGYGLVVVEGAAKGVPVVVVAGEDNAATELVEEERNGFVAGADPRSLADALIACVRGGGALRTATRSWYAENKDRLSMAGSQREVEAQYATKAGARRS